MIRILPLFLIVAACSSAPAVCGPDTCGGCCDLSNTCVNGDTDSACGTSGSLCTSCTGTARCMSSVCVPDGAGGGGGGMGGGSAGGTAGAGGGSGGGSAGGTALGTRAFIRPSSLVTLNSGSLRTQLELAGATGVDLTSQEPADFNAYRLVVLLPAGGFAPTLISKLTDFVNAGGRLVVVAERSFVGGASAANSMMTGLGRSIRVDSSDTAQGCSSAMVTGTHPLTAGTTSIPYSWGSRVTGGTTLYTINGQPAVTTENRVVLAGDSGAFLDGSGCSLSSAFPFMQNLWTVTEP
jgi:hypothetical protein